LTLHLHGAAVAAERNQELSRQPGVLVTVVLPGLSAIYVRKFSEAEVLRRIIRETEQRLQPVYGGQEPHVARLVVTSFSAGYGGVREMLKSPEAFARIDAVVLADSLYAGFEGDPAERKVSAENMEGFLRFAREAVAGRKAMIVTHSALETPTYGSTVETADYLLRQLGGTRKAEDAEWKEGLRLRSSYRQGHFQLLGFAGDTGAEHMKHLHGLWQFLERLGQDTTKAN
jgi:hypothetical protein